MGSANDTGLSRRSFMKWSGAVAGTTALVGTGVTMLNNPTVSQAAVEGMADADKTVNGACFVNCGSRCPLRLQVRDGRVVRILPDATGDNELWTKQIRACLRGRDTRARIYGADRIKYPLKRREGTKRGEGVWDEISWDEAIDLIAEKMKYTYDTYGPEAVHWLYGSGIAGSPLAWGPWQRLFNTMGGQLGMYGNYSYAQIATCTRFTYGTPDEQVSNSFEDMGTNSKLVVMFGDNPQETRMSGGGNAFTSLWARDQGVKYIHIDPRYSDSAALLGGEWIPIRPGTDTALVNALVYVMIDENLHDQEFLDKYVQGFDEEHMPEGIPAGNSYKSYIMGDGDDKTAKTPQWASSITGIPAERIVGLAREIANAKPCGIVQGWGPQRHMNGENIARAIYALAAVTGNVGLPGGGTGGREGQLWPGWVPFPWAEPEWGELYSGAVSCFGWLESIDHGPEMTATKDGVRGVEQLKTGIKFLVSWGSNMLGSQHADLNKTKEIMSDESKCEFVLVIDNQMTHSTEVADLVLPDTVPAERWDLAGSEYTGDVAYIMINEPAIDPLYDIIDNIDVMAMVADKLGVKDKFCSGGRETRKDWIQWILAETKKNIPDYITFDELLEQGVYRYTRPNREMTVPLKEFRADPEANKLDTPSGKIEIFSSELWEMANSDDPKVRWEFPNALPGEKLTALPEHMDTWESATEAKTNEKYPLQMIGHHYKGRAHSTFGNLPNLLEAHPQKFWINTQDAADRGISHGDQVQVFNDRGRVQTEAFVTPRIAPGVTSLPQGAWPKFGEDGIDYGGANNTLTSQRVTALAKGNAQHTALVQVEKA